MSAQCRGQYIVQTNLQCTCMNYDNTPFLVGSIAGGALRVSKTQLWEAFPYRHPMVPTKASNSFAQASNRRLSLCIIPPFGFFFPLSVFPADYDRVLPVNLFANN